MTFITPLTGIGAVLLATGIGMIATVPQPGIIAAFCVCLGASALGLVAGRVADAFIQRRA